MSNSTFKTIGLRRLALGIDGEGVTTLVCGHGCPLSCEFCLNPQGLDPSFGCVSYTPEELIDLLAIDSLYFVATGGGVTFGGGEPLLQSSFIHEFAAIKPEDWKINVETSLSVPRGSLELVLDDIDGWIIDVKTLKPSVYESYAKQSIDMLLSNLDCLKHKVPQDKLIVKVPEIPGYTDSDDVEEDIITLRKMGFENIRPITYVTNIDKARRQ